MRDDADRARYLAADDDRLATLAGPRAPAGAPCQVARTKVLSAYPTVAGAFYAVESLTVTGAEAEGGAGTFTPRGNTFLALNLGSAIPPQGTALVVTRVRHRWVFRHDG